MKPVVDMDSFEGYEIEVVADTEEAVGRLYDAVLKNLKEKDRSD